VVNIRMFYLELRKRLVTKVILSIFTYTNDRKMY